MQQPDVLSNCGGPSEHAPYAGGNADAAPVCTTGKCLVCFEGAPDANACKEHRGRGFYDAAQ